jgi:hypothetical protein
MKPLLILIFIGIVSGCAENTPRPGEVREHFERGLSGQGQIVPLDNPNPEQPVPPPAPSPQ